MKDKNSGVAENAGLPFIIDSIQYSDGWICLLYLVSVVFTSYVWHKFSHGILYFWEALLSIIKFRSVHKTRVLHRQLKKNYFSIFMSVFHFSSCIYSSLWLNPSIWYLGQTQLKFSLCLSIMTPWCLFTSRIFMYFLSSWSPITLLSAWFEILFLQSE